jgi:hypothetical protein
MLSPVCDHFRLVLGIITALGGIVFASMTSSLREDITNLFHHRKHSARSNAAQEQLSLKEGFYKSGKWLLLIISFIAIIVIGPYIAVVPSKTCVKIVIAELQCDPAGDEYSNEFVRLKNLSNNNIYMKNWKLCDYQNNHCFQFGEYTLMGKSVVTIWTKTGTDTLTDLYFNEKSTLIWNNGRDTAYLFDPKDQLIFQLSCS